MTSLEFIEKEIKELEFQINYIKSNMEKYVAFRAEGRIEVDMRQLKLNQLQQIKSELVAWEELNELFIIKPYYQDKENNKHPAIMIQHKIEKDFEYVRRGCKQKSFDTIKKALEEKDE